MSDSPVTLSGTDREVALGLYRTMLVIRKTELQLAKAFGRGLVHGACHTYVGQEAIAAGVCAHLSSSDVVFSTHRGHGHALAKGIPPFELIAELFGRAEGCSRGRGGSMHLFAPEVGMMGTSGIVGPAILQAVGGGYSFKLRDVPEVSVGFFGDGAVNNGAFHEGLNLASIWDLPVLFVCENNQYATEVPFAYFQCQSRCWRPGPVYGMPSQMVDGNDAMAVYRAAQQAIDRARAGDGPTLLECKTYRTRAHAEGMADTGYRTSEEVTAWKDRCPVARMKQILMDQYAVANDVLTQLEAEVSQTVDLAADRAEHAAYPDAQQATTHIFGPATTMPPEVDKGNREITFAAATHEALSVAMEEDANIFVLGEGVGARGGNFQTTTGLYDKYGPLRLCDTPICERGFVGLSTGAAMTGTRPVVDFMFADFVLDGMGEIINQIAKMQYMSSGRLTMPVVLRGCIGIGHSAATHHSGSYYSMFAQIPGVRVVVPATPYDAKGLLLHALRGQDPVIFLEHRELLTAKGPVPEQPYEIPFGQAAVAREGTDVTVVAVSRMLPLSLTVAESLEGQGVSVEIIDPRTVAPLDTDTIINSVAKTGRLLIVDETAAHLGVGAEIAARVADVGFDELDAPIRRLNGKHTPTPYSPTLEAAIVPNEQDLLEAIQQLLQE